MKQSWPFKECNKSLSCFTLSFQCIVAKFYNCFTFKCVLIVNLIPHSLYILKIFIPLSFPIFCLSIGKSVRKLFYYDLTLILHSPSKNNSSSHSTDESHLLQAEVVQQWSKTSDLSLLHPTHCIEVKATISINCWFCIYQLQSFLNTYCLQEKKYLLHISMFYSKT